MKLLVAAGSFIVVTYFALAASANAATVPECSEAQLHGYAPTTKERDEHRKFEVPTLKYPFGTELKDRWGIALQVKIDPSGSLECYRVYGQVDHQRELTEQRRRLFGEMSQWSYQPFLRDGKAVTAVTFEQIREEEAPESHQPLPDVPLDQVHIRLVRGACFTNCPAYTVDIFGDGRVVYTGDRFVDVVGEIALQIPSEQVAQLVGSMRSKDLWSLRDSYRARITDNSDYELTLGMGEQEHRVDDYVGAMVGMPKSVSDFEAEIDEISGARRFINLSREAVATLESQKFDFRSQAGAELLARAVSNTNSHDDAAMLRLVELGTPIVGARRDDGRSSGPPRSVIEDALLNQRAVLIDPLIQRGALETNGAPDQEKIDAAFRAAIAGGLLQPVQKIWAVAGSRPHPSLTFESAYSDRSPITKTAPVTLLLNTPYQPREGYVWEGFAIAKWLAAKGCDLEATTMDGQTLLNIAAKADDANLVRYLLRRGLGAAIAAGHGVDLSSVGNEDVAMLLLKAGANPGSISGGMPQFRLLAELRHWTQVLAWLDSR